MQIFIYANESQREEIGLKKIEPGMNLHFSKDFPSQDEINQHDAFFLLNGDYEEVDFNQFNFKPVIINAVSKRLSDYKSPKNVARINGWPGFLEREIWEIASGQNEIFVPLFQKLSWKIIAVQDEPGLVAARVVSMIINEAFYAFNENISTKKEIDLAMKSGTNYPFGPFEWAEKIGIDKVSELLKVLAVNDQRYIPSFNQQGKNEPV
jgi:3-hydroxybutyryl-CoA dehydrogenase